MNKCIFTLREEANDASGGSSFTFSSEATFVLYFESNEEQTFRSIGSGTLDKSYLTFGYSAAFRFHYNVMHHDVTKFHIDGETFTEFDCK